MGDISKELKSRLATLPLEEQAELADFLVRRLNQQQATNGPIAQSDQLPAGDQRTAALIADLQKQVTELQKERDMYLRSLSALLWKDLTFTAEELAEMERNGPTAEQIIQEVERITRR